MRWIIVALLLTRFRSVVAFPDRTGITSFLSGLAVAAKPNPVADVPVIGAFAETVPALRNIPGLSFLPKFQDDQTHESQNLNSAIEKFASPLLRLAAGDPYLMTDDLDQMFNAAPKLMGKPRIDLSQFPPEFIVKAFHGDSIPGLNRETVNEGVKDYTLKIYKAAALVLEGHSLLDRPNLLLILNGLPPEIVADVVRGARLPYLAEKQMEVVKTYFGAEKFSSTNGTSKGGLSLADVEFSPELFRMIKFLPQGYDLNRIPKEVVQSIAKGELPNLGLLPVDLQHYFVSNFQRLFAEFAKSDLQFEDIIKLLPTFERKQATTFSPYETKSAEKNDKKHGQVNKYFGHYAMIVVGLMGFVSVAVLGTFCFYRKRANAGVADEDEAQSFGIPTIDEIQPNLTPTNRATCYFNSFCETPPCEFTKFPLRQK